MVLFLTISKDIGSKFLFCQQGGLPPFNI
jgi:hypothetical protein